MGTPFVGFDPFVAPKDSMGTTGPESSLKSEVLGTGFLRAIDEAMAAQGLEPRRAQKPLTPEQRADLAATLRKVFATPPDLAAAAARDAQARANATGRPVREGDLIYFPRTPQEQAAQDALDKRLETAQADANRTKKPVLVDGFFLVSPEQKPAQTDWAQLFKKLAVDLF